MVNLDKRRFYMKYSGLLPNFLLYLNCGKNWKEEWWLTILKYSFKSISGQYSGSALIHTEIVHT